MARVKQVRGAKGRPVPKPSRQAAGKLEPGAKTGTKARRSAGGRKQETPEQRRARAGRILTALRTLYPEARCALHHRNAYELLVATILSAQCTDERVNQITPALFQRYPDARALAGAEPEELEAAIRSTGFFRNKTRSLLGMARKVCEQFGGSIPDTMDGLLTLPGVARKTANCVLGTWFGRNEGIVVDTHVGRLSLRLGLAPSARDSKDAARIERDLMAVLPRDSWTYVAHALIHHGRTVCTARRPRCEVCALAPECPSAFAAR